MALDSVNGFDHAINGHGQSAATPTKLDIFEGVLRRRLAKFSRLKHVITSLWVVDLNAGSGWNRSPNGPLPGTPLLAANVIQGLGIRCHHILIDHDRRMCNSLDREWRLYRAKSACCDNGEWLSTFDPGPKAGGLILCDPNGPKGTPYEELQEFSRRAPYFDYLVNHNLSAAIRCNGVDDPKLARGMSRYSPLADRAMVLDQFGKRYFLVGENNVTSTKWFIFLCTDDPLLKSIYGLCRSDSLDGKRILMSNETPAQLEWKL